MTKFTKAQERILLDEGADPIDRAHAITCMRSDGIRRHESLLIGWLDHEVEDMRSQALATLLAWGRDEFAPVAFDWLRTGETPELRVRMANALSAWGMARPTKPPRRAIQPVRRNTLRWAIASPTPLLPKWRTRMAAMLEKLK